MQAVPRMSFASVELAGLVTFGQNRDFSQGHNEVCVPA
jgi:hypothetical protein